MKKITFLIILANLLAGFNCFAQPGIIDESFNSLDSGFWKEKGLNNAVNASCVQSDGKIIVGGNFTSYNGIIVNRITRFNTDGTLDTTFNLGTGANGSIHAMVLQSDGKIIIGGSFVSYNGVQKNAIARLNTNGSIDSTFNSGTGVDGNISSIAIQNDGKIVIGGQFISYNGASRGGIARINSNGSLDSTFDSNEGIKDQEIKAIAIQSDGKIVIGGLFISYNGTMANNIVRLNSDATVDHTFNIGTGTNDWVQTAAMQKDGKILIGGMFTSYNGATTNRIARLNIDGTVDPTFNMGTGTNGYAIYSIITQSNGKILIGGDFTSYNGRQAIGIVRLNTNGIIDSTFDTRIAINDGIVECISIESEEKIVIGGSFFSYNGTMRNYIARVNTTGSLDKNIFNVLGSGVNGNVSTTSIQNDGKIIIGGSFSSYNGIKSNSIARLNLDGSLDTAFNYYSMDCIGGAVYTTLIQSDGKIIISGGFISYNGKRRNSIARLNTDGSPDTTFNPGTGANDWIQTIALQSDGKIVAGGFFTSYNNAEANNIIRLNSNGSLDSSFKSGKGTNYFVETAAVQSDGKILIGGSFTSYNGTAINNIARLNTNGTIDLSFNSGLGADAYVANIILQEDKKIIISGLFTSYNGSLRNGIARLNPDGSIDSTFDPGTGVDKGIVYNTSLQSDGKIIIGGAFTVYNGTAINNIARIDTDGNLDKTFKIVTGTDRRIMAIAIQKDQKIIIGGSFTSYDGTGRNCIARIHGNGTSAINEVINEDFISIYPNPNTGQFTLKLKEHSEVSILDVLGRCVLKKQINSGIHTIDISTENSGFYFVKVVSNGKQMIEKFIINN